MKPFYQFMETELYKSFPWIKEEDYLGSNDYCVVTKNKVFYSTQITTTGSIIKGYLKSTFKSDIKGLFDKSTYAKSEYHQIGIDEIESIKEEHVKIFAKSVLKNIEKENKEQTDRQIYLEKLQNEKDQIRKEKEELLNKYKKNWSEDFDKDDNGEIDLIQNDFNKLLNKYQKQIIEVDKNYVHQFVKISKFIKTKKENIQKIFESIKETSSKDELEERVSLLKNQIHAYELLVFHSVNMIGSLVSENLITFYEIYESFDKLGMYNSNWENEVSEKLANIGDKLDDLMHSIYNMEQNIVSELSHLSYVTQESFENLNMSVSSQLKGIESSVNMNNLLTGIQTYQLYKINKSNKELRS
jgi:hypothetical protein